MRVTFRMIRAARVNSDTASQKRSLEKRRQRRKNSACFSYQKKLLTLLCRSSLALRPSGKYSRIRTYVRHMNCFEKFPPPSRVTLGASMSNRNYVPVRCTTARGFINSTGHVRIPDRKREGWEGALSKRLEPPVVLE